MNNLDCGKMSKSKSIECTHCGVPVVVSHGEPTLCTNCFVEVIIWGASQYVGRPYRPKN